MSVETVHDERRVIERGLAESMPGSLENRFLARAGHLIADGLSDRSLAEAMVSESLQFSGATYGCLLSVSTQTAPPPELCIVAIVVSRSEQRYLALRDTLKYTQPDAIMQEVLADGRPLYSNRLHHGAPESLPGGHPELSNFALLATPDPDGQRSGKPRSLLFLANSDTAFEANALESLLTLLEIHDRLADSVKYKPDFRHPAAMEPNAGQQRASPDSYRTLTSLAPVGVLELDENWLCVRCNERWREMSSLSWEQTMGIGWVDVLHHADIYQTLVTMRETVIAGRTYRHELRLENSLGRALARWVELSATALDGEQSGSRGTLIVLLDITMRRRAEQGLLQVAHYDSLTGLMNRNFFVRQLHAMLDGSQAALALLHLDLDNFKHINESYGHAQGDSLLQHVARQLSCSVRELDLVARHGSDEFSIVLTPMRDTASVSIVTDKIMQQIARPFVSNGHELLITASIGIAVGTGGVTDAATLIRQADNALQRAKRGGRARYLFHSADLEQEQREHAGLLERLRHYAAQHAFEIHYQPQLRIRDQKLLGFEALLRWPGSDAQDVEPAVFIDLLEQVELLYDTGLWVIEQSCRQFSQWCATGLVPIDCTISVNVSATQLRHPDFVRHLSEVLDRQDLPAAQLVLEITESALVQAAESTIISRLKQIGVMISLDDFGTGYSSLAYLSDLPVDHLKIDRSFILATDTSRRAVTIVKSIIALARTLGILVVAEGVENSRVLPLLAREGCEAWQGFFSSPAIAASAMPELIEALNTRQLFDATPYLPVSS